MPEKEYEQFTFDFANETAEIIRGDDDGLKLRLGEFAGPLDLLLFLIKQEQANIFDIPVARITDEYVRYVRLMKKLDIAVAADFLVMAATLIEIKSKMLLPRDPAAEPARGLAHLSERANTPRIALDIVGSVLKLAEVACFDLHALPRQAPLTWESDRLLHQMELFS